MDNKMTAIIAVVVVAIVVIAAGAYFLTSGNDDDDDDSAEIASQLQLMGNANNDFTIDDKDKEIIQDVIDGNKKLADYPLADANNDGTVDSKDIELIQKMIDRTENTEVFVVCLDRAGDSTVKAVQYPLRNVVPFGTNVVEPTLYANGGQYVAGYFHSTYKNLEASLGGEDFGSNSSRGISDASWKNFTELDAKLSADGKGGIGAVLGDSSAKGFTEKYVGECEAAGIPVLFFSSADAESETATVLTLGYLFGTENEKMTVNYAQTAWDVFNEIKEKVGSYSDEKKSSYIAFNMYIYVCQNDSTFNKTAETAGGIPYYKVNSDFAKTYAGSSSAKMNSPEALSNYDDADALINIRSIDIGLKDADAVNKVIIDSWDHSKTDKKSGVTTNYIDFFKDLDDYKSLVYVNNLLPGGVKVAYMAHAMYGDVFSLEWADGILQKYIDMGSVPLTGQTLDSIVAFFDYDDYQAALKATES